MDMNSTLIYIPNTGEILRAYKISLKLFHS